jgi:hypothetical protein
LADTIKKDSLRLRGLTLAWSGSCSRGFKAKGGRTIEANEICDCSHCDLLFTVELPRYVLNHKKIQVARSHVVTGHLNSLHRSRVVTEHLIPVHEPSAHGVGWRWQVYDGALHLGHHIYAVSYPLGSYSTVL